MADSALDLYYNILQTLENLRIDYVIIGAFAGIAYGVTRATFDVDIVVDLKETQIEALASAYPPPRFYADPMQMRDSIKWGILFNIIDTSAGRKVDLIPLTMKPGYGFALANRIRRNVPVTDTVSFQAWFAKPEDVIIGKLMAWSEGGSYKHESDIRDILISVSLGEDEELSQQFDFSYVDRWAYNLGENVEQLWQHLKGLAQIDKDAQE